MKVWRKYHGFIWCLICFAGFNHLEILAQTAEEENLYEDILGARPRALQISLMEEYLNKFCGGNNGPGIYCQKIRRDYEDLTGGYGQRLADRCDAETELPQRIICLQDLIKEYGSGELAESAQIKLAQAEEEFWLERDADIRAWAKSEFESYLQLFPSGKYAVTALDRIDLIDLGQQLDAQDFFNQHISGKGDERLTYFQFLHPTHPTADLAKQQSEAIEQIRWEVAQRSDTRRDYQNYLKWYPNGKYTAAAQTKLSQLPSQRILGPDEQRWAVVERTEDPYIVQNFLDQFPNSKHTDDAQKLLIELDVVWWERTQALGSAIAYENYIEIFPDGAFVPEAKAALPNLTNEGEDLRWANAIVANSLQAYQSYLIDYPTGKYRSDAVQALQRLRGIEYTIRPRGFQHIIQFRNASNLTLLSTPDTLIVDPAELQSHSRLIVTAQRFGYYQLRLIDEDGTEIIVDWNRDIEIREFLTLGDSISLVISGGFEPYSISLRDTADAYALDEREIQKSPKRGLVKISKKRVQDLLGPGVYTAVIRDDRRKQTSEVEPVIISISMARRITTLVSIFAGLSLVALAWFFLNRRINKRKSVFDDMDLDGWETNEGESSGWE